MATAARYFDLVREMRDAYNHRLRGENLLAQNVGIRAIGRCLQMESSAVNRRLASARIRTHGDHELLPGLRIFRQQNSLLSVLVASFHQRPIRTYSDGHRIFAGQKKLQLHARPGLPSFANLHRGPIGVTQSGVFRMGHIGVIPPFRKRQCFQGLEPVEDWFVRIRRLLGLGEAGSSRKEEGE